MPADARHWVHREWLCVHLRSNWTPADVAHPADSLLAIGFDAFIAGERAFQVLFAPTPGTCLEDISWTRDHLILKTLEHVKARLQVLTPQPAGSWACMPLAGAPHMGSATVLPCDPESNAFFLAVEDFLTPTALLYGQIGEAPAVLKTMPTFFNADGLQIEQHFATSADGTRVPYFQVGPAGLPLNGSHRTLLDGYGGFEVSLLPSYSGSLGRGWLAAGGVYVLANIRGGGEYGPLWHQAAVRGNRPRAYEDFAAVAADLVARAVTHRDRLGITGGSNGGLLVGNMPPQYPERVGAIVCRVPLLDMRRYVHLLAGASWIGEYGDPEQPEDWAFLRTFSPYHGLRDGQAYRPTLLTTSTRDDRVRQAHARKMMAKMRSMGCEVHYYENIEGGHGGAADNAQAAYMTALGYAFLRTHLASDPAAQRPKP